MSECLDPNTIKLLLRYIPPKDALSLRACSKHLNKLISYCQSYWYHQNRQLTKHVHVKRWTIECITPRYDHIHVNHAKLRAYLMDRHNQDGKIENFIIANPHDPRSREFYRTFFHLIPPSFCGRYKHFHRVPILYGEIPLETSAYRMVSDPEENVLQMYKFLFNGFRTLRKKVKAVKTDRIATEIPAMYDRIEALESEVKSLKSDIVLREQYPEKVLALKDSPFRRKRESSYHKKKEIRRSAGLKPYRKKRKE